MIKKYSVAFYPSKEVIAFIKSMKELLKSKIGWYSSCNSTAHITICEFSITEAEMSKIKTKLSKVCDGFTPFKVNLDHFDSYINGAFFIAPDSDSKENLKPIMKKTQEALLVSNLKKSNDPHLSIGRKLTSENLEIASQLFTKIDLNFECNAIVLRELDPIKKQFFVIDTFSFNGNTTPELVQGTLF